VTKLIKVPWIYIRKVDWITFRLHFSPDYAGIYPGGITGIHRQAGKYAENINRIVSDIARGKITKRIG
jgi:hypothetical protein